MTTRTFISTHNQGISRAWHDGGAWQVEHLLAEHQVQCLAVDPHNAQTAFAGTRTGLLRSTDGGRTWAAHGLAGRSVKSIAVSQAEPGTIYAGLKPPEVHVSRDGGETWQEIESFRRVRAWWWRSPAEADLGPYIQGIALSPTDPNVIVAGIEAGAVLRSEDGGQTWAGHRPGAVRDCHSIIFHANNGGWAYEAGGTGAGAAVSRDSGQTWQELKAGLDRHYGWAVAADPARPEVWYVSASPMFSWQKPGPPPAHVDGHSNAYIFRATDGRNWQKLGGGLPQPLNHMAYALLTDPAAPGHLYAGLANGDVWHSDNHGDNWQRLPFNLGGIHRSLVRL